MNSIADFIVKHPTMALAVAAFFSCLPVLYFFSWVMVAFMTLQFSPRYGALALLWTSLPAGLFLWAGHWHDLFSYVLLGNGLVWGLACLLRQTHAWVLVIELAMLFGVAVIVGFHLYNPDLVRANQELIYRALTMLRQWMEIDISQTQIKLYAQQVGPIYMGLEVMIALTVALSALMLGRIWQGNFNQMTEVVRKELHGLYVGRWATVLLGLCVFSGLLGYPYGLYVLPVVLLPFIISGLSVVHSILRPMRLKWLWLSLFYISFLFHLVTMMALLVIIALLDRYVHLRDRLNVTFK